MHGCHRIFGALPSHQTWIALLGFLIAGRCGWSEELRLSVRDVGEYGNVPWIAPDITIAPGSREDRVRDLNFAVGKVHLTDELQDDVIETWTTHALQARGQQKKLLLQLDFWDGADRYEGPLRETAVYAKRLQSFLGALKSREALTDLVGIVLAEENVHYAGRPEVLAELYRRIKGEFDVSVWQWWSPMEAVPSSAGWIPADGWVIDPYFMTQRDFRRYLRCYVSSGVPIVVMPWASAELEDRPPLTAEQWQSNQDQLEAAVEFDLPVAFFWTFKTGTHFGGRRGGGETEIDRINEWVWKYVARVQSLPEDYEGLASADRDAGRPLELAMTEKNGQMIYTDDFHTQKCISDAAFSGFRDCVMDGKTLSTRGYRGRPVEATLTYHFRGDFVAKHPKVTLTARTLASQNGKVETAISLDGTTWERAVASTHRNTETLTLSTQSVPKFSNIKEFWIRISLMGDAGTRSESPASIDDLRIVTEIMPPKSSIISLKPSEDNPSILVYEDDFQTRKYLQTTQRINDKPLEWTPGSIGVRMRPGGSEVSLVWRIRSEQPLRNIKVLVDGRANRGSLGSNLRLDVSRDGKTWGNDVDTNDQEPDAGGWCRQGLTLDLSDNAKYQDITTWLVRLTLSAPSFKEVHRYQSGIVQRMRMEATR